MKTRTVVVREGENVGPVDWDHPLAKDMPAIWREAEQSPKDFTFDYGHGGREILTICMYDGWPYWKPMPAVCYVGPLNSAEWSFFNSYGVNQRSVQRRSGPAADKGLV
jgi:hypothetical protein